ncbi:hypothetical protein RFI_38440 [Reticulomyxa filosa]|uniref:E3 ubiquitin-protein ligase n=1 Tax=Reticulomyxa filosa TaxID=46433 RepID=X6LE73_RETFI|nr:hypothetical protein RFI_38440 [Reticulomyxa filosa]|eukprot:ETN99044.1 hypothetical protein RFI_38440 [Reticulomyxa filosa]
MVEELLMRLIQLVSEPKYRFCCISYMKNKANPNQHQDNTDKDGEGVCMDYVFMHWLALGPLSYNEVYQKVPDLAEFDLKPMLQRIARYESPNQNQFGKYYLKREHFVRINPYFYKYTAEQRKKVLEIIQIQIAAAQGVDSDKKTEELFSVQWPSIEYSDSRRLELLGTSWMGILWTCILHHVFVNDTKRFTQHAFACCLRLIALAVEVVLYNSLIIDFYFVCLYTMSCAKIGQDTNTFDQLIKNLTTVFDFRLTNRFDYIPHKEAIQQREIQRLRQALKRLETESLTNTTEKSRQ